MTETGYNNMSFGPEVIYYTISENLTIVHAVGDDLSIHISRPGDPAFTAGVKIDKTDFEKLFQAICDIRNNNDEWKK